MASSSTPPEPNPSPELIEAAAAAWLSLRDRGLSQTETAEFVRWLQQDPQHAAVFAELDRVWQDCDRLSAVPAPSNTDAAPDADLLAPRVRARRRPRLAVRLGFGLAAAAAVALLIGLPFWSPAPRHTAETVVGAFQKLDLPDGSVAQLNTNSAIDTDFTANERRVAVVRGEVYFNVSKDPDRPFIVTSGGIAVRAVGTAFNVRQREHALEVLVTEGRVRVDDVREGRSLLPTPAASEAPPLLVAGERAIVSTASSPTSPALPPATVEKVDLSVAQRALAWQERRLEFDEAPLSEVVGEFNRYNRHQLVIADPALASKRFSGTFRADSYESLVRLLETDFGVTASRSDREIVLHVHR
jgi:transmembrane sensor